MIKKIGLGVISILLIFIGCFLVHKGLIKPNLPDRQESHELKSLKNGEVFENGSFIKVEDVLISYNGESFEITNSRSDCVRVICSIIGVKEDGSYDFLGAPSFNGVDTSLYEKEKSENGWALKKTTNLIRPNESLVAVLNNLEVYRDLDVDKDGYFDIIFTISPQVEENTIRTSTKDVCSEIYKIEVK